MGVAAAGSNTLAEKIESAVDAASANTSDSGKLAAYASLKQAAGDKATATAPVNKAADLAQVFSSGVGSKATAISSWATAATTDKSKAKQTADASTSTANVLSIGGNAESVEDSSAGVTGDPASGQAATAFEQALQKLASAMVAANTALQPRRGGRALGGQLARRDDCQGHRGRQGRQQCGDHPQQRGHRDWQRLRH